MPVSVAAVGGGRKVAAVSLGLDWGDGGVGTESVLAADGSGADEAAGSATGSNAVVLGIFAVSIFGISAGGPTGAARDWASLTGSVLMAIGAVGQTTRGRLSKMAAATGADRFAGSGLEAGVALRSYEDEIVVAEVPGTSGVGTAVAAGAGIAA